MDLTAPDRLPIRTERLTLRLPTPADVDALHAYRSIPDVCRYVPFEPQSTERIAELIDGAQRPFTGTDPAVWLVAEAAQGVIGDVILFVRSLEHQCGEIGYVFDPAVAGQGYATEAARGLLAFAFDVVGMRRVIGRLDARNTASARVLERVGMRREAHLVENEFFKGEWSDEYDYAILAAEFAS